MMNEPITIIGRGIAGLSLAYHLVNSGKSVVVMGADYREDSASRCAPGIASVKGRVFGRDSLFLAKLAAHQYLRKFIQDVEITSEMSILLEDCHPNEPFWSAPHYSAVRKRVYHSHFTGLNHFQTVGEQDGHGCFLYPSDFIYDTDRLLVGLERSLKGNKLCRYSDIYENVTAISIEARGYCLQTKSHQIPSNRVVLACGKSTYSLLETVGYTLTPYKFVDGVSLFAVNGDSNFRGDILGKNQLVNAHDYTAISGLSTPDELEAIAANYPELIKNYSNLLSQPKDLRSGSRVLTKNRCPSVGNIVNSGEHMLGVMTGFYKSGYSLGPWLARWYEKVINLRSANMNLYNF